MVRKSDDDWQESHQPTSLVFDNIDRLEETLSGAGTTRRIIESMVYLFSEVLLDQYQSLRKFKPLKLKREVLMFSSMNFSAIILDKDQKRQSCAMILNSMH